MQPPLLNPHQHALHPRRLSRSPTLPTYRTRDESPIFCELADFLDNLQLLGALRLQPLATLLHLLLEPGCCFFDASGCETLKGGEEAVYDVEEEPVEEFCGDGGAGLRNCIVNTGLLRPLIFITTGSVMSIVRLMSVVAAADLPISICRNADRWTPHRLHRDRQRAASLGPIALVNMSKAMQLWLDPLYSPAQMLTSCAATIGTTEEEVWLVSFRVFSRSSADPPSAR
ncbi:hypothetical protein HBH79_108060 [Parastagonospora nodorum]|nr:hypothetical protein HBH90_084620 [Parastagonospora nodorum]KAH4521246.1 hypothetical protein HBH87_086840 [Parastagonospora nodorum]KAH4590542.1 hypothetical protein HBH83_084070 [Parastagonospora nodorum]KAH4678136.1 hypothetical protein HBH79_108060 [Parastagonospora nodorum]KAH4765564.1 hypothetical protein HBH65_116160 [Parastagonospora nodorum]